MKYYFYYYYGNEHRIYYQRRYIYIYKMDYKIGLVLKQDDKEKIEDESTNGNGMETA